MSSDLDRELGSEPSFAAYPRAGQVRAGQMSVDDLTGLAAAFRGMTIAGVWWIAAHAVVVASASLAPAYGGYLLFLANIIFAILLSYLFAVHAKALGQSRMTGVILGAFFGGIPFANMLILALASSRLLEKFKKAGIKMGFYGPDRNSLAEAIEGARSKAGQFRFDEYPVS